LAMQLENKRNGAPVFSLGIPGSSLFDYLERVRFAYDKLDIRKFWIVVERADVRQSLCEHAAYTDVCLDIDGELLRKKKPPRDPLRDILARSALLQYFVGVLRLSPKALIESISRPALPNVETSIVTIAGKSSSTSLSSVEDEVIERFFRELSSFSSIKVGVVIDPRLDHLDRDDEFIDPALESVYRQAIAAGITVVHPFRDLKQYSDLTGLEMRVGPYDGHWNARANAVIAKVILRDAPM